MKVVIAGALGRMGRMLIEQTATHAEVTLAAVTVRTGQEQQARAVLGGDVRITPDIGEALDDAEGIIDFTRPAYTLEIAAVAARLGKVHVCGTTGFSAAERAQLEEYAKQIVVVLAPNMSVGVNLLLGLVHQAAAALDVGYDIEIAELHHRHKQDAPSGTALALGEAAARGRGVSLEQAGLPAREGLIGERPEGGIGFAVRRGGEVVGEHTVLFAGPGERVELTHQASDRAIYARGAIRAVLWAKIQPPGLYSMQDVLGLRENLLKAL